MKLHEIRQLSEAELEARVGELREEIFNLKFQKATRQASDTKRTSLLRREIAQIYTIIGEHRLGIRPLVLNTEDRPSETNEE
jgi:large subunit ribosomal protein L29